MSNPLRSRALMMTAFILGWSASLLFSPAALEPLGTLKAWADLPTDSLARQMFEDLNIRRSRFSTSLSSTSESPYLAISLAEAEQSEVSRTHGEVTISREGQTLVFGMVPVMICENLECNPCREGICIAPRKPPINPLGPIKLLNFPEEPESEIPRRTPRRQ